MKRVILPGLLFFFMISACTIPRDIIQKKDVSGTGDSAPKAAETSNPLDNLERDMQRVLSVSEAALVSREDEHITVTFQGDATFDSGSILVKPDLHAEIDRVARVLARYPEAIIRVDGHTDSKGSEQHNMALSKQRAESVRSLLFKQVVGQRWIEVAGFGETRPIATNDTEAGRQKNRRVEIQVALPNW